MVKSSPKNFSKTEKEDNKDDNTGRIITVPNVLSLVRLALLPFLLNEVLHYKHGEGDWQSIIILGAVMVFTDLVDGLLARKFKQISSLGRIIDPVTDSFTIDSMAFIFVYLKDLPLWSFTIIFVRDIIIALMALKLFLEETTRLLPIPLLGKATPISWCILYLTIIFGLNINIKYFFLFVAVVVSILSTVSYFSLYRDLLDDDSDDK